MTDTNTDEEILDRRRAWTAITRVMHDGREIGGTRQPKGSAEVHGHVLDQHGRSDPVGTFKSHAAAEKAVVSEWQRRAAA